MPKYIDTFLIPVPKSKLDEYRRIARLCSKVWLEHGALEYVECLPDDVSYGKQTSFPRAVERKRHETVVFAYIAYRSRAHRDRVNKKAMNDPRLAHFSEEGMPFDGKRMIWGGFKSFLAKSQDA